MTFCSNISSSSLFSSSSFLLFAPFLKSTFLLCYVQCLLLAFSFSSIFPFVYSNWECINCARQAGANEIDGIRGSLRDKER